MPTGLQGTIEQDTAIQTEHDTLNRLIGLELHLPLAEGERLERLLLLLGHRGDPLIKIKLSPSESIT